MKVQVRFSALLAGSLLLVPAAPAIALDFDYRGWTLDWSNHVTAGVAIRTEKQDPSLIGKSNLDPSLCAADECLTADPANSEPNDRYLAAPGALNSVYDEGDLNYRKGDLVASPLKWTSRLTGRLDDWKIEAGFLAFYDPVNTELRERHPNLVTQAGPEHGEAARTKRDDAILEDIGYGVKLLDTLVTYTFDVNDFPVDFSIGRQRLVWGESTFVTQGSLNVINPPDANLLVRPGMDLDEVYKPEGMALLQGAITDDWSGEAFYQFEWRPVGIPARGSYLSFFNAGNRRTEDEGIIAPFAKTPYDPRQIGTPANPVFALLTQTSFTVSRAGNHDPSDQGQFGAALYWHPEWMDGSEVGFYFANYHSRIPAASAIAAQPSCTRREGNPSGVDAVDLTSLIAACGAPGSHMREAVPLDTAHYFLDYPEDVKLFGLSFSTVVEGLAVRGELAYHPNQPVQVDLEDVLLAALQPALPRQDIPLFGVGADTTLPGLIAALQDPGNILAVIGNQVGNVPGALTALQTLLSTQGLLNLTVPGCRRIPDFVTAYRGGTPCEVEPGSTVRGYERLHVVQGSLGLTKIFGNTHFLGTRDALILGELTDIWVTNLPSRSKLQFEAPGTDTHAGPGASDSGNSLFLNPIRNTGGYVTSNSWGYRLGAMLHYADVLAEGLDARPFIVFTHDVSGVSPGLGENFLEGRKLLVCDIHFAYGAFDASFTQTFFLGGGDRNTLHDRDFFSASVGMHF